jgi:ERCC4-related helicase
MTDTEPKVDPRLTPYQAEFFRRFTDEVGHGSIHVLVAPVGTGKSFAVAGTISELARTRRLLRTLILAPAALVAQWAGRLRELGRDPVSLDAQTLRLLRERIGGAADKWPDGVYVMSIDLAKRPDIRKLVAAVSWSLVTFDEDHRLAGERLRLMEEITSTKPAPALLLVTGVPRGVVEALGTSARLIDWSEAVAAFRLGDAAEIVRSIRTYRRSNEEAVVAELVLRAAQHLDQRAVVLVRRATSSVRSLEDSLVRWLESGDEVPDRGVLEQLLRAVEELRVDSKLDCFMDLVRELLGRELKHVVVLCEYRTTMEYVAAAAEGLGARLYLLHGSLSADQQRNRLNAYTNEGGILIATSASEGVSLSFVEAVVHYDLPFSLAAFAAREGRYQRYGRRTPCTVYFLEDETRALPVESLVYRTLQKVGAVGSELDDDVRALYQKMLEGSPTGRESDWEDSR